MRYHHRSSVTNDSIELAGTEPGVFFDGYAESPALTARALLCVAQIARARFYPEATSGRLQSLAADPVVTAEPGRLRFESFSQCCGVHARLDLLPDGMDVRTFAPGTTNVDFGEETRASLAMIGRHDPLRLRVEAESIALGTIGRVVTEHRVRLPDRWVKGFGEVQVAMRDEVEALSLEGAGAVRFLQGLPRGRAGRMCYWTVPAGPSTRLLTRPTAGAVPLVAPARLQALRPLASAARSLTAYTSATADRPTTVIWVLELPGSRISLALSSSIERGFSGEGGLLFDLASPRAAENASVLRQRISREIRFTKATAAESSGLSRTETDSALTWLGMYGELGRDIAEGVYFWRHLPYPKATLAAEPPRLRDARTLARTGSVNPAGDNTFAVSSNDSEYRVTITNRDYRCTCPWIAKHGTARGPCKHVLATMLAQESEPAD